MEPLHYFLSVNFSFYSCILLPQKKHFSIPLPHSPILQFRGFIVRKKEY